MRVSALGVWLRRLSGARGLGLCVLLACLLCAPALGLGLIGDDLWHRRFLEAHLHEQDAPGRAWEMFESCGRGGRPPCSAAVHSGFLPWWTSPDYRFALLRPLSVATHYLDYLLWPDAPWLMHLHSIGWYALAVLLAGLAYRRVLGAASTAASLALVLYAIDEAHVNGAAWIAGRNGLLTACFALLAIVLHDRGRRDGARGAPIACTLALLAALAAGEGGYAAWAYLGAYALFLDRGSILSRVRSLALPALVTAAFAAFAQSRGYVTRGSGLYVDPREDPLAFAEVVTTRLPAVLRVQLALPLELERAVSARWEPAMHALGYALLALFVALAVPLVRRRASARFFACGAVLGALPICAGGAESRVLFLVGFGAHGLLAELAMDWLERARERPSPVGTLRAATLASCLAINGPLAVACAPLVSWLWRDYDVTLHRTAQALPAGGLVKDAIIVVNATDLIFTMFVRSYREEFELPGPDRLQLLGTSTRAVRVERPRPNVLVLEPEGGYLLEPSSRLVRSLERPFRPGDSVTVRDFTATVETVTPDGRPARVRFEVAPGAVQDLLWVTCDSVSGRLHPFSWPPVGGSLTLPPPATR